MAQSRRVRKHLHREPRTIIPTTLADSAIESKECKSDNGDGDVQILDNIKH